jgi:signal transduction histidine kinase
VDNAVKFSDGKPVKCRFRVKTGRIIIEIIDEGVGISEKDQKNLFQPFFRAPNTRNLPGHGLGLALSNKIIRMHKGHIEVTSKENEGTAFRIEFQS